MSRQNDIRPPNGHDTHRSTGFAEAQCPYCGQPISRKEFKEIQARMVAEEAARSAKREQQIKDGFAREMAKAETAKKAEIEKARREAAKVADTKLKAIRDSHEATINTRLLAQREASDKKMAAAVNAEKVKAFEEKSRLTEQLAEMQRRLERKTAHELGEPGEVDLFEQLVAAFPDDRISRVVKGQKGPDIIVEVVHNDAVVGKVVIDCKNHKRWQNGFTSKLRGDQLDEGAEFAVLSTAVFPSGVRQLHMQDQVIVADPARVAVLIHLLRRQIVDNYTQKLGSVARDEKAAQMYAFILSPRCDEFFDKLLQFGQNLAELDAVEAKSHRVTWEKRAVLVQGVLTVREKFCGVVSDIIGGGR